MDAWITVDLLLGLSLGFLMAPTIWLWCLVEVLRRRDIGFFGKFAYLGISLVAYPVAFFYAGRFAKAPGLKRLSQAFMLWLLVWAGVALYLARYRPEAYVEGFQRAVAASGYEVPDLGRWLPPPRNSGPGAAPGRPPRPARPNPAGQGGPGAATATPQSSPPVLSVQEVPLHPSREIPWLAKDDGRSFLALLPLPGQDRVMRYRITGEPEDQGQPLDFRGAEGLAVSGDGAHRWVIWRNRLAELDEEGLPQAIGPPGEAQGILFPRKLLWISSMKALFVSARNGGFYLRPSPQGSGRAPRWSHFPRFAQQDLRGLAFDPVGKRLFGLVQTDESLDQLVTFTPRGERTATRLLSPPLTNARRSNPKAVQVVWTGTHVLILRVAASKPGGTVDAWLVDPKTGRVGRGQPR